jgi:tetratricopeptide (TPR) repeat protein
MPRRMITLIALMALCHLPLQAVLAEEDAGGTTAETSQPGDAPASGDAAMEETEIASDLDEALQSEQRLLTNIVIGIEEPESVSPSDSLFGWRQEGQGTELQRRIESMMKDASLQNRIQNYDGAIDIYTRILEMDTDNMFVRFSRGTAYVQAGRFREALDDLLPIMEQYPDNHMIKNNVAWIYATADDISIRNGAKAVSLARDAVLQAPSDIHIWNTLSEAYFVSAQYEKALKRAEIALQIAIRQSQPEERLNNMVKQVEKCRQAVATMSIMD